MSSTIPSKIKTAAVDLQECFLELVDNDTLIIAGLIVFCFYTTEADLQNLVVGGMLAYLGVKKKSD